MVTICLLGIEVASLESQQPQNMPGAVHVLVVVDRVVGKRPLDLDAETKLVVVIVRTGNAVFFEVDGEVVVVEVGSSRQPPNQPGNVH